jgi:hypothetical protein
MGRAPPIPSPAGGEGEGSTRPVCCCLAALPPLFCDAVLGEACVGDTVAAAWSRDDGEEDEAVLWGRYSWRGSEEGTVSDF